MAVVRRIAWTICISGLRHSMRDSRWAALRSRRGDGVAGVVVVVVVGTNDVTSPGDNTRPFCIPFGAAAPERKQRGERARLGRA